MPRGTQINGYRSKFEQSIATQLEELDREYEYENKRHKIKYDVPASGHTYLPDFAIFGKDGKCILIEPKGIWDFKDRNKHLLIRQQWPDLDIRFVFQRAKQRIRKGSKTTYRDICEGRGRGVFKGVMWKYSEGTIPKEWLNE